MHASVSVVRDVLNVQWLPDDQVRAVIQQLHAVGNLSPADKDFLKWVEWIVISGRAREGINNAAFASISHQCVLGKEDDINDRWITFLDDLQRHGRLWVMARYKDVVEHIQACRYHHQRYIAHMNETRGNSYV